MNNIIPASRLGELLAVKTGADVDTCTKFVKEYFGLIEATLSTGEDVTIKGIGTFMLTGDDVDPVVYVVDKDLAATVNAPFDAFSAIELADNEMSEPIAEPEAQPEPAPAAETAAPEAAEEPQNDETITIDEIPEPAPKPEPAAEAETVAEIDETEAEDAEDTYERHVVYHTQIFPKGWAAFWMVMAFVLGLFLGTALGYFGYKEINKRLANMPETVIVSSDDSE